MQLLWIVNSGFFGVTRTSMSSFNSYLAGSQDKCIFWLFKNEFPRENFELSFPTFESGFEINSIKNQLNQSQFNQSQFNETFLSMVYYELTMCPAPSW